MIEFENANDDDYIFYSQEDGRKNELKLIDLNTFQSSIISFNGNPNLGNYAMAAKISNNKYFYYGGRNNEMIGNTYVIDIANKTAESLMISTMKFLFGGVARGDIIYTFGGCSNGGAPSTECKKINLLSKTWTTISNLPTSSYSTSASIISDIIHVAGFHLNNILKYNENSDSFTYDFLKNFTSHKYIFKNWIITDNGTLYEYSCENKWIAHQNQIPTSDNLRVFTSFRKNKFIYFVFQSNGLYRIDTQLKKIEKVVSNT